MSDSYRSTPAFASHREALQLADAAALVAELRSVGLTEVATFIECLAAEVERLKSNQPTQTA